MDVQHRAIEDVIRARLEQVAVFFDVLGVDHIPRAAGKVKGPDC